MDNNTSRGMTLDSRTFVECSRRMQNFNPTLPRNMELIQTPLGHFEMVGNEGVKVKETKIDTKNRIMPPKITIKCPTPTPPPRKKGQPQQPQIPFDENSEQSTPMPTAEKAVKPNSLRFYSNKFASFPQSDHHHHNDSGREEEGQRKISHETAVFSRPVVQFVMDWMTNIANNLDCPPV